MEAKAVHPRRSLSQTLVFVMSLASISTLAYSASILRNKRFISSDLSAMVRAACWNYLLMQYMFLRFFSQTPQGKPQYKVAFELEISH